MIQVNFYFASLHIEAYSENDITVRETCAFNLSILLSICQEMNSRLAHHIFRWTPLDNEFGSRENFDIAASSQYFFEFTPLYLREDRFDDFRCEFLCRHDLLKESFKSCLVELWVNGDLSELNGILRLKALDDFVEKSIKDERLRKLHILLSKLVDVGLIGKDLSQGWT